MAHIHIGRSLSSSWRKRMALQWTGELRKIVESAERDASRMHVRINSALLLRSMVKNTGTVRELLGSVGVTLDRVEDGLRSFPLNPEHCETTQHIYERAARQTASARSEAISTFQVLIAMFSEPCMAQNLLKGLQVDLDNLKRLIYESVETSYQTMVSRTSSQHAMNAVAVQCKSTVMRPPTYIEPQPAASFGLEDLRDEIGYPATSKSSKGLLTPGEIAKIKQRPHTTKPDTPARTSSASYRTTSSREMQQSTTLELARRLQQKKSQTSEALEKPAAKSATMTSDRPSVQMQLPFRSPSEDAHETREVCESPAHAKNESQISSSEEPEERTDVTPVLTLLPDQVRPEPEKKTASSAFAKSRTLAPIVTRANAQALNNSGSVLSRKPGTKSRDLVDFNPFELPKARFPMLTAYGRNLLAEARAGRLDPVINRDNEIEQLVDVLNKRRSNNPILVGEAGVGKTAIIEGLALKMAQEQAPHGLEKHTIIALDYGSILCGTQLRGAVQERIKNIKNEVNSAHGHIILFLDEIHHWLSGSSGDPNADAAQELKMALSRNELMCIGASTPMELRRAFNNDPAFERRFDFIEVKAPDADTSIRIIQQGIIKQYETHHNVTYEPEAIRQAVRLSERYIQERALPDKAISVLDRAGSFCQRSGDQVVTVKHVAQVISLIAEVPIDRLLMTEKQKLMNMENILGKRLIGHQENITKISNVIRRNHAGFGAQRPIGSFLFLGPTGVGKTEAAKVLADYLFGSPKNIVRFDMSEFMEQHSVAKLIGAPAGYVGFDDGGLLTEALRKRPYQIVLFDEIEKAHPDILNILLQILDEGRLTDAKGRHVSFANTVVIMTSNLGAQEVTQMSQNGIGFAGNEQKLTQEDAENIIIKTAKSRFSPELWNRIEEKLVFHPLTREQVEKIAHLLLMDSSKRLKADKCIEMSFDEITLIPYLIKHGGFDPNYGARPMRKTIQSLVESRVAEWILSHDEMPKELYVSLRNNVVTVEEINPGF